jgi:23S rRNA pseudouridine1911/1915/1917 synthase
MAEWIVQAEEAGTRADVFIAQAMGVSRGEAQRLLDLGAARVDGVETKANRKVRAGETVTAEKPVPVATTVEAEAIPLDVVYEDEDLLVINKPRGMVVHPAPGAQSGTLVNAVLAHADDLSGIGGELRPGIVHRLDKDTSGLLMVAKTDAAHASLQVQIQAKTAERKYQAILWGAPKTGRVIVDAPIDRHPGDRKKMAVRPGYGRDSITELAVLERLGPFTFAEARLQTGRTHQIRVHCAYIGLPVVGDPTYGGLRKAPAQDLPLRDRQRIEAAIDALHGQALHAYSLSFDHPRTGERLSFNVPMPPVMQDLLDAIRDSRRHSVRDE